MKFGWCLDGHHTYCVAQFQTESTAEIVVHICSCPCHTRPAIVRSESNPSKKRK